jgi:hypothetical protein
MKRPNYLNLALVQNSSLENIIYRYQATTLKFSKRLVEIKQNLVVVSFAFAVALDHKL